MSRHKKSICKHICFLAPDAYSVLSDEDFIKIAGGAEVQQKILAKALKEAGCEITFVVRNYSQNQFETRDGIKILRFPFAFKKNLIWDVIKLVILMKKIDADIYILQTPNTLLPMMVLFKGLFGGKLIKMTASNFECRKRDLVNLKDIYRTILNIIYLVSLRFVDYIIFQTEYQKQCAFRELGLHGRIIRNPAHAAKSTIIALNTCNRDIAALWVGTCTKNKQPHIFLDIAESMPEVKFTMIIAPGMNLKFNEIIASRAKNLLNVDYKGFIPYYKIAPYFYRAKILVNTSLDEGFPNIFLQAWQAATPVVSLHVDLDGIIAKYELGRVSKTLSQMQEDILYLLHNEELRNKIGNNCKKYLLAYHDPGIIAQQFIEIFKVLLKEKK